MKIVKEKRPTYRARLTFSVLLGALCLGVLYLEGFAQQSAAVEPPVVDFDRDIQPILTANCVRCHQGAAESAELRLDSSGGVMKGGTSGPIVLPGNAEKSLLMIRVNDTGNNRMPPGGNLSAAEIDLLRMWINQGAKTEVSIDFVTHVEPIFRTSCYSCHAGNDPRAGLHLDNKELALKGGVSGPPIVPGNSKESLLLHRVRGEVGKPRMPRSGTALNSDQIAILEKWIDQGANWPDTRKVHWAYVKPVRPAPPAVRDTAWVRNPIDNFILARLEKEGLVPSPEATKETLVRRLYLDLIGLPPSPTEVDALLTDRRPDAYERLVDRLLASPYFGERMATPWLDLARYGDSNGYERDYPRIAWPYRDWVVKAFNDNKPFDQFTIEQLAGDLLPNATTQQLIATGFVRSSMTNTEAGVDSDEQKWVEQLDRTITVGNVFFGSTVQCAQCHNHKYDPFTQKHFYEMVAFFSNSKVEFGEGGGPFLYGQIPERRIQLPTPEQAARCEVLDVQKKELDARLNADTSELRKLEGIWEQSVIQAEKDWQYLQPTRLISQGGATLTVSADHSIMVSGVNPENDMYVIEARTPVSGKITGIRIEALLNPKLPLNGPGRDDDGNFVVNGVTVEAGSSAQLANVGFKLATDLRGAPAGSGAVRVQEPVTEWRTAFSKDATRTPTVLLAIPGTPIQTDGSGVLRITLTHSADRQAGLGNFRVSVTTSQNPERVIEVPAAIRPLLAIPAAERARYPQYKMPLLVSDPSGRYVELPKSECAQPTQINGDLPPTGNEKYVDPLFTEWKNLDPEFRAIREQMAAIRREIVDMRIPSALVLSENREVTHPKTFIHERGMWTAKGEEVEADVPSFLGSLPKGTMPNRLGLAKWLVGGEHPLTARVRVNQIWQMIFGLGIVETSEDFGTQGFAPSHPELLDWLATEFVNSGWDQKALLRLVVTSSTYRQSSNATRELIERDPRNILLARGARYRVEAEMVRDIALTASGLLSKKIGGPPVMPPEPAGQQGADDVWIENTGEDRYRRGLYLFIRRGSPYSSRLIFDATSHETTIARRSRSNTPFQALTLLNEPVFFEAAQALARRIQAEGGPDTASRITYGFRLVTSRKPSNEEADVLRQTFEEQRTYFLDNPDETTAVSGAPDTELAAWTVLANALLNLNETITRE